MPFEVTILETEPRRLAAVRRTASVADLGSVLPPCFDAAWALIRAQSVPTAHNVCLYESMRPGPGGHVFDLAAGVEVTGPFHPEGEVEEVLTPGGTVALCTLIGPYSELASLYGHVREWLPANGHTSNGTSWEVYGDWTDDQTNLLTDVYFGLQSPATGTTA